MVIGVATKAGPGPGPEVRGKQALAYSRSIPLCRRRLETGVLGAPRLRDFMPVSCIGAHSSASGAGGPVRCLPVAWGTKEAPPPGDTRSPWPLGADTRDWGRGGFICWTWTRADWPLESECAQLWVDMFPLWADTRVAGSGSGKRTPGVGRLWLEQAGVLPPRGVHYAHSCLQPGAHFPPATPHRQSTWRAIGQRVRVLFVSLRRWAAASPPWASVSSPAQPQSRGSWQLRSLQGPHSGTLFGFWWRS